MSAAARPVVHVLLHDLGRTGVPVALARLITWEGARDTLDLHLVARHDGPLRAELEGVGIPVVALGPETGRTGAGTVAAAAAQLGRPGPGAAVLGASWRRRVRRLPDPDVVLVQGAGGWAVAEALHATSAPRVVVHLHELHTAIERSATPDQRRAMAAADGVLVVSEPVAALARTLGTPADRITLVPGTVELEPAAARGSADVVTIGEAGWRKGTDRALAAAADLRRRNPDLRWHGIGRSPEPGWGFARGGELPVDFHPPAADPWSVVDAPAALVVTSREDPLPLVALEAGARGLPVVALAGSGGLDQLLADGRGWLVDPVDPAELAEAVATAAGPLGTERGAALRAHVREHHATEAVGPQWLAALLGR